MSVYHIWHLDYGLDGITASQTLITSSVMCGLLIYSHIRQLFASDYRGRDRYRTPLSANEKMRRRLRLRQRIGVYAASRTCRRQQPLPVVMATSSVDLYPALGHE